MSVALAFPLFLLYISNKHSREPVPDLHSFGKECGLNNISTIIKHWSYVYLYGVGRPAT